MIIIKTIPHSEQKYPTVGNWIFQENGDLLIEVSDMGNPKFELLVGLHELIEANLCKDRGITDESVTEFDKKFEKMRLEYPEIIGDDEPGNHPKAPYNTEHQIASRHEISYGQDLKVDFAEYEKAVNSLN